MNELPSLRHRSWLKAPPLQRLFNVVREAGGEARVAGGAVRNSLLGVPVTEIDLATTLTPDQVIAACEAARLSVHPTGIEHGTVTVVVDHRAFEVTTLRQDINTDGRRAQVQFTDDWRADALRRDFTMNAMFCDQAGKIYDFTGGYADTLRKRIIFVGDPSLRIVEDYLRILRFFRFHAMFGNGPPGKTGLAACVKHRNGIDRLSQERIQQEMFKLLVAPRAVPTLRAMSKNHILEHILPYTDEWKAIARLPPDPVLRLAVLARNPMAMKELWHLSNHDAARIETIAKQMPPSPALRLREQRIVLYQLGAEAWWDLVDIAWARSNAPLDDTSWKSLRGLPRRWPIPALPVSGGDLVAIGMTPGPEIGEALRRLEDWWMASDFKPGKVELLEKLG